MIQLSQKVIIRTIKEYAIISFGLMLYSFGWMGIILPAKIVGGGASGMAMLIYFGFGIPVAYSLFAINGILLAIAAAIIDIKFSAKTIYAVFFLTFSMGLMQSIVPPDLLGLGTDRLLSAILGGAIAGIGISICFGQGGSTGGTDIIAMIINKYRNISYGKVIIACDFFIIGLSYFINYDITTVIYSYVLVAVCGYALDAVMAGNKQSSQVMIVSTEHELIAEKIAAQLRRGVTLINGEGWYSKEPTKIVMVVCRKDELGPLLRITKECDSAAFITVGSVMGVYGLGFEPLKK